MTAPPSPPSPRTPAATRRAVTRARPDAPLVSRIEQAAQLMRTLKYRRGVTDRELAAEWKVSLATAQGVTAEASRVVARELADPGRLMTTIGTRLEQVMLEGDDRDAVNAAAVAAKLHGLNAAERHEVAQVAPVVLSEEWAALRTVLLDAIRPYPEAYAAVVAALEAYAERRQ